MTVPASTKLLAAAVLPAALVAVLAVPLSGAPVATIGALAAVPVALLGAWLARRHPGDLRRVLGDQLAALLARVLGGLAAAWLLSLAYSAPEAGVMALAIALIADAAVQAADLAKEQAGA